METLGTFKDVESAIRAVDSLIKAGFTEETITSLTSVPYPNGVIVKSNQRTWFRWLSAAGGVIGAAAGFALAAGTAYLYPVQTGDKPIIAYFPTGIITYEITMLFAILGAIGGMFLEMKLPPWREKVYDPAIGEGAIGISVSVDTGDRSTRAETIMKEAGALRTAVGGNP
ncbi:MAG TPA: quinol:electron acceptor oxidoreductase subunit ActD [Nitrospirota bacterium]|nr:quinol:electron acceptor oxidoreductase subunit ActD [Nitrospirota bacterium]